MNISRKLIEGVDDAGDTAWFVVEGNPDVGYDLLRAHLSHVAHHRRSWQAIAQAHGESPAAS